MTNKRILLFPAGWLSYVLISSLAIVFITQVLSCDDGWRPEGVCEQEVGPYPDYTQDKTHIKAGETVRYTYSGPEYINYKLYWEFEGGQKNTTGNFNVMDVFYPVAGVYKVTIELQPTKCPKYDTHFKTYNPSVWVEP